MGLKDIGHYEISLVLCLIDLFSLNVCFPKRSCLPYRSQRFFSYLIHVIQKGAFCPKTRFEATRAVFRSLSGYEELNLSTAVYRSYSIRPPDRAND